MVNLTEGFSFRNTLVPVLINDDLAVSKGGLDADRVTTLGEMRREFRAVERGFAVPIARHRCML
jgi:hypothetical protein